MMMTPVQKSAVEVSATSSGIPVRNLWYMLVYAWSELQISSSCTTGIEESPGLDALLATVLANLMQQRLRVGLGRDYRDDAALISGIRGRIDFAESLKRMSFQNGKAHCRFQTFSPNVPKNQIIRSTLTRLAQSGDFGPQSTRSDELRHRLRQMVHDLDGIDAFDLKPAEIRRQQLRRHDADYRAMLTICYLVAERLLPAEDRHDETSSGLDRDEMTLWRVFERFIASFFTTHLVEWEVMPQKLCHWPVETKNPYLPTMHPDVVFRHKTTGRVVVMDSKFTPHSLVVGPWRNQTFDRNHLFQIYAYLRSQEDQSQEHLCASGILLYPTVKHHLSTSVEIQGHAIRWETVDLSLPWKQIETRLLAIMNG